MTREYIINLKANETTNMLVSSHVMKHELVTAKREVTIQGRLVMIGQKYVVDEGGDAYLPSNVPDYSGDMNQALLVAGEIRRHFNPCRYFIICNQNGEYRANFVPTLRDDDYEASAETAPLAICRAALLATLEEK